MKSGINPDVTEILSIHVPRQFYMFCKLNTDPNHFL